MGFRKTESKKATTEKKNEEIKFNIEEEYGVLGERSVYVKEKNERVQGELVLSFTSWNDKPGKYDIRPWTKDRKNMGAGITLTCEEAQALYEVLKGIAEEE